MRKIVAILLVGVIVLSLTACMSSEEQQAAKEELIHRLGGKTYYCHNFPSIGRRSGQFEEDVLTLTFSEDCTSVDAKWEWQVSTFTNGFKNSKGPITTEKFTYDVEITVKSKDSYELVLTAHFQSADGSYGREFKEVLTVKLTDNTSKNNGLAFDDAKFSMMTGDPNPLTTETRRITGLR